MKTHIVITLLLFGFAKAQTWHSFQGYEYLIVSDPFTYSEAEAGCAANNATLAYVKTTELQNFLATKIANLSDVRDFYYIGATRIKGTNNFQWSDGTSFNVTHWQKGEPNNAMGNEDCVFIGWKYIPSQLYKWIDDPCSSYARSVCQRPIASETDNKQNLTLEPLMSTASSALQNVSSTSQNLGALQCQYNIALPISAVIGAAVLLATFGIGLVVIVNFKKKISQLQHKTIFDRSQHEESNHENANPARCYMNEDAQKAPAAVSFATYVNTIDNQRSVKNKRKENEYVEFNE